MDFLVSNAKVRGFFAVFGTHMSLPITGSASLLDALSPYIADDFVNDLLPRHRGRGRRSEWSSAQLLRVLLLLLLTPARSSNLLCELLPEHRSWRRFAHLPNKRILPNPRQLHEFRDRLTPANLRGINEHLLRPIIKLWPEDIPPIGLMDATDLPASTNEYKKRRWKLFGAQSYPRRPK